jgi:hypothetical protein
LTIIGIGEMPDLTLNITGWFVGVLPTTKSEFPDKIFKFTLLHKPASLPIFNIIINKAIQLANRSGFFGQSLKAY